MANSGHHIALHERVVLWLADHPGSTSHEVAVGVTSRAALVAEVLQGSQFRKAVVGRRVVYHLAPVVRAQTGRGPGGKETDCEFLHRVLSDGRPHNLNEILQRSFSERGCGLTVHSRAADLRRRGLTIANWKDGERGAGSWYRLERSVEASERSDGLTRAGDSDASTEPSANELSPVAEGSQLALTGPSFCKQEAA